MIEQLLMILTGIGVGDFIDSGDVFFVLTNRERWEMFVALVKCAGSRFNKSLAECGSDELEDLLCGYKPERYIAR